MDSAVEKFLRSLDHCRIATIGADGTPHCVPISYFYDSGLVYLPTAKESQKVMNLTRDDKCCVVMDFYEGGRGKFVMIQGSAKPTNGEEFERTKKPLESIGGWKLDEWSVGGAGSNKVNTIIVLTPKRIVSII